MPAFFAFVQVVVAFLLITYGENHISSSLTAILISVVPIYTALLALDEDTEGRARDEPAHRVGLVAEHDEALLRGDAAQGLEDPGQHRPAGELVEQLDAPGLHPLAFSRRQNHRQAGTHRVSSLLLPGVSNRRLARPSLVR